MDISQFCNICSSMENVGNICNEEKTIIKSILLSFIDKTDVIDENNIYICSNCCNKLQDIYEFKEICVKNLIHYQNLYKGKLQLIQNDVTVKNELDDEFIEEKVTAEAIDLFYNEESLNSKSSNLCHTTATTKNESYDSGKNDTISFGECSTRSDNSNEESSKSKSSNVLHKTSKNESYSSGENDINSFSESTRSNTVESKLHTEIDLGISGNNLIVQEQANYNNHGENMQQGNQDCNEIHQSEQNLTNDKRVPTGGDLYKCNECGKPFTRSGDFYRHLRIHSNERPYQCTICEKSFKYSDKLMRHKLVHTGKKPYKCTTCEKSFAYMENLKLHSRVHTGETPYKCDICEASFTQLGGLNRHKLIHTGEKPFHCNICLKTFRCSTHLKRHVRVHTGEKPYECNICKNRFASSGEMNAHKRVHCCKKFITTNTKQ